MGGGEAKGGERGMEKLEEEGEVGGEGRRARDRVMLNPNLSLSKITLKSRPFSLCGAHPVRGDALPPTNGISRILCPSGKELVFSLVCPRLRCDVFYYHIPLPSS